MRSIQGTAAFIGCLAIAGLSMGDAPAIQNVAARNALERRETVAKKILADYGIKLAAADTQLANDLDSALRQALRDGVLPAANELSTLKKEAMARAKEEKHAMAAPVVSLAGQWRIRTPRGTSTWTITAQKVDVDHGGNMKDSGKATIVDGVVMVQYQNGWVERFTPLGDRLFFEAWDPKFARDYATVGSTDMGIGLRVK